jgi:PBSX family phage terminase large subunit
MPSSVPMLRLKRHPFEDIFETAKRDARIRQQRDEERRRERERLEHDEREKPAIVPVVQHLNRQVLPWALPLQEDARYKGASGGRGRGASHFFAEEAVEAMVKNPSLRFACIREVQKALKFSAKSLVEMKIRDLGVPHLFTVLEREIRRNDGDGIMIFEGMQDHTAESIKSLESFGRAWVEEAHSITDKSLKILLGTMRLAGSEVWFSWNPDQPTDAVEVFFAKLAEQVAKGELPAGRVIHRTSTYLDNPLATRELIEEALLSQRTDSDEYEHIWMGGFDLGGHGRVYSKFRNKPYPEGNIDESIEDAGGELIVGMDFNVNPMTAVIGQRVVDEYEILDALEIMTSNTDEMRDELLERYPGRHIIICPDPSGKRRQSSAPVGQTDFTILENAGFEIRAPNAAPPNVDSYNNANLMLFDGERRRVRIHPDAKPLTNALASLVYKEGTNRPDKNSRWIHITDAFKYPLWEEFNVVTEVPQWGSSSSSLY